MSTESTADSDIVYDRQVLLEEKMKELAGDTERRGRKIVLTFKDGAYVIKSEYPARITMPPHLEADDVLVLVPERINAPVGVVIQDIRSDFNYEQWRNLNASRAFGHEQSPMILPGEEHAFSVDDRPTLVLDNEWPDAPADQSPNDTDWYVDEAPSRTKRKPR